MKRLYLEIVAEQTIIDKILQMVNDEHSKKKLYLITRRVEEAE